MCQPISEPSQDIFGNEEHKYISTSVEFDHGGGNIAEGLFWRTYSVKEQQLTMKQAFLWDYYKKDSPALPSWINAGVSYPGREGIPTATFFTLYQMKKMGIEFGSLKRIKWEGVINLDTQLHLKWLTDKYPPGTRLEDLIANTHSIRYAEGAIVQSGHKIVPNSFVVQLPPENFRYKLLSKIREANTIKQTQQLSEYYKRLERWYGLEGVPGDTQILELRNIYVDVVGVPRK